MSKLILLSVLIAMVALPAVASGTPDPKRGLKRMVKMVNGYYLFYAFALLFLWGRC